VKRLQFHELILLLETVKLKVSIITIRKNLGIIIPDDISKKKYCLHKLSEFEKKYIGIISNTQLYLDYRKF
jgi:hypothetical protein